MKCQGCLFPALAVRRPASTICWTIGSGTGVSLKWRTARTVRIASNVSMKTTSFLLYGSEWESHLYDTIVFHAVPKVNSKARYYGFSLRSFGPDVVPNGVNDQTARRRLSV